MTQVFPTIAEARERFSATLIAKSPYTATNYRSGLNRLDEYLRSIGKDPQSVTTNHLPDTLLDDFYTWLLTSYGRQRRNTAVTYVAAARAFIRFLDQRHWLDPAVSYERMKTGVRDLIGKMSYRTPRVDDAIATTVTLVNSLKVPAADERTKLTLLRDRAIINTLYSTGMRRSELASLNRADIQDGRASEGLITGKGEKERVVFFDQTALDAIHRYLAARNDGLHPMFLRHDDGRGQPGAGGERWRLSPQSVWGVVKRYGKLAGVEVTTHHLRHLKARVMLNAGAQLSEVQDILGHSSPETTKRIYASYTTQHLRQAFDRFSLSAEEVASRVNHPGKR